MTRLRQGFGGQDARLRDRPRPVSAASAREAWRGLVRGAQSLCATGTFDPVGAATLANAVREATRSPFPIEDFSAREAASGLLHFARAFNVAGAPRQDLLIPALSAAARAVDRILDEPANDMAARTRRQLGERD